MLWDEPYDATVAARTRHALQSCVDHVPEIGQASAEGIRLLMQGLCESGLCMAAAGHSRPAAGAEHYISHYLELKLLRENRPAVLHGAKVALACIQVAGFYDKIRQLTQSQVAARLNRIPWPDRTQEIDCIKMAYGPIAGQVIAEQRPFLDLSAVAFNSLRRKIVEHWTDILEIAATVPSAQELTASLQAVGGAVHASELGLSDTELAEGVEYSHYFRNRFTVLKLSRILGVNR